MGLLEVINKMKNRRSVQIGSMLIITILISMTVLPIAISVDVNQKERKDQKQSIFDHFIPFRKNNDVTNQFPFLTGTIQTICGSTEKTAEIMFGQFNELDVDNNDQTGRNGKDIRIQYIILPWLELEPTLKVGLRFSLNIERIGNEIKSESFTLSSDLFEGLIQLGYHSPEAYQNEIPEFLELSAFLFYTIETGTAGITLDMDPVYDTSSSPHLTFFTSFEQEGKDHAYEFMFEPVSKKQITIESTRSNGLWQYHLKGTERTPTKASLHIHRESNDGLVETELNIDPLPSDVSFSLGITPFSQGGGSINYESSSYHDSAIIIESNNMGACEFAVIKNIPKEFSLEWDPAKEQGYYHLSIDAVDTTVYLVDSLQNPTINLSIQDIETVDISAYWNFTNPGDFTVIKDTSFHVNLDFVIGVWEARIDAESTAKVIKTTWLTDVSGYFSLDTNNVPLNTIDLLIKGSDLGIRTEGEYVKAQDFFIEWTIWPPLEWNLDTTGSIDFHSMDLDVFIEGMWYHLWPWF